MTPEIVARVDAWISANVSPQAPDAGPLACALVVAWADASTRWRVYASVGADEFVMAALAASMRGLLLALVREAWGEPYLWAGVVDDGENFEDDDLAWSVDGPEQGLDLDFETTEDEALATALEAAPRREGA